MYDIAENGTSGLLSINLSPEVGDGPRNSLSSPDGERLYVVSPFTPTNHIVPTDKKTDRSRNTVGISFVLIVPISFAN